MKRILILITSLIIGFGLSAKAQNLIVDESPYYTFTDWTVDKVTTGDYIDNTTSGGWVNSYYYGNAVMVSVEQGAIINQIATSDTISWSIQNPWLNPKHELTVTWANEISKQLGEEGLAFDPITNPCAHSLLIQIRYFGVGETTPPSEWQTIVNALDRTQLESTNTVDNSSQPFSWDQYSNGKYTTKLDVTDILTDTIDRIQYRVVYIGQNAGVFAIHGLTISQTTPAPFNVEILKPNGYTRIPTSQLNGTYNFNVNIINNGVASFDTVKSADFQAYVSGGIYSGSVFGYNTIDSADFSLDSYPNNVVYPMLSANNPRPLKLDKIGGYSLSAYINGLNGIDYSPNLNVYVSSDEYSRANGNNKNLSAVDNVAGYGSVFQIFNADKFKGISVTFGVNGSPYKWHLLKLASQNATTGQLIYSSEVTDTYIGTYTDIFSSEDDYIDLEAGYYMVFIEQTSSNGIGLCFDDDYDSEYYEGTTSNFTKVVGNGNANISMYVKGISNNTPYLSTISTQNVSVGTPFSLITEISDNDEGETYTARLENLTTYIDASWLTTSVDGKVVKIEGTPSNPGVQSKVRLYISDGTDSIYRDITFNIKQSAVLDPEVDTEWIEYFSSNVVNQNVTNVWNVQWDNIASNNHWYYSGSYIYIYSADSIQNERSISPSISLPEVNAGDSLFFSFKWLSLYSQNGGIKDYADIKLEVFRAGTHELLATLFDDDNQQLLTSSTVDASNVDLVWPYADYTWYTTTFNVTEDLAGETVYLVFTYFDETVAQGGQFRFDEIKFSFNEGNTGQLSVNQGPNDFDKKLVTFSLPYRYMPKRQFSGMTNKVTVNVANLGYTAVENAEAYMNIKVDTLNDYADNYDLLFDEQINRNLTVNGLDTIEVFNSIINDRGWSNWRIYAEAGSSTQYAYFGVTENCMRKASGNVQGYKTIDAGGTVGMKFNIYKTDILNYIQFNVEYVSYTRNCLVSILNANGELVLSENCTIPTYATAFNFSPSNGEPFVIEPGEYTLLITPIDASVRFGYDDDGGEFLRNIDGTLSVDEEIDGDLAAAIYFAQNGFNFSPSSNERNLILSAGVPFNRKIEIANVLNDALTIETEKITLPDVSWINWEVVDNRFLQISGVAPASVNGVSMVDVTLSTPYQSSSKYRFTISVVNSQIFDIENSTEINLTNNISSSDLLTNGEAWNTQYRISSNSHWGRRNITIYNTSTSNYTSTYVFSVATNDSIQNEQLFSPSLVLPTIESGDSLFFSFVWRSNNDYNSGVNDYADIKVEAFRAGTGELLATLYNDDDEQMLTTTTYTYNYGYSGDGVYGDRISWPYQYGYYNYNITKQDIEALAGETIYLVFTYTDVTASMAAGFRFTDVKFKYKEGSIDLLNENNTDEIPSLAFSKRYSKIPVNQMSATSFGINSIVRNIGSKAATDARFEVKVEVDSANGTYELYSLNYSQINVAGNGETNVTVNPLLADVESSWRVTTTVSHNDDIDASNNSETITLGVTKDELSMNCGGYTSSTKTNNNGTSFVWNFDIFNSDVLQGIRIHSATSNVKVVFTLVKNGQVLFNTRAYTIYNGNNTCNLDIPYSIEPGAYTLLISGVNGASFDLYYDNDGNGEIIRGTATNQVVDPDIDGDLMISAFLDNDAPTYNPALANKTVFAQTPFEYNIGATDENADSISFFTYNMPAWLILTDNNDGTAKLAGTPSVNDIGSNVIEVYAADGRDSTLGTFIIEVEENPSPYFTSTPSTSAIEGVAYSYTATAADPYGDDVTVSAVNIPSWITATVSGSSVVLDGTPASSNIGSNYVRLQVTDEFGYVAYQDFTIAVLPNDAPEFISTPTINVIAGNEYVYYVLARDNNVNDILTISAVGTLPSWLTLSVNGNTAILRGIPTEAGSESVTLMVADNFGASAEQTFTIEIEAANSAPIFTSTAITSVGEGETYNYQITATDADNDALTFMINGPSWLVLTNLGNGMATLRGTPLSAQSATVVLTVSDGELSAQQSFEITVSAAPSNAVPTFISTPITEATVGAEYNYSIEAIDGDNDALVITADAPSWLAFVDNENGTATLSGTPVSLDRGICSIFITAFDGKDNTVQNFQIGVEGNDEENEFSESSTDNYSIYPNPANNFVNIEAVEDVNIIIYDLLGRVVYQTISGSNITTIEVSNIPTGIYLVKIGDKVTKRVNIKH